MSTPKSTLYQIYNYWEIVEQLTRLSRQYLSFDLPTLERVIKRYLRRDTDLNTVLTSLLNAGVLEKLSRTDDFQLNPMILEFTKSLTREHELGLSEVLKVRIEGTKKSTNLLSDGIESSDSEKINSAAKQLAELVRKISLQLKQDKFAILEVAENAKSAHTGVPIERRYREVLETYDQYIEPMNDMLDSSSSGSFYPLLEQAERVLDSAFITLSRRGALYQQRLAIRQLAYQVKELRVQARVIAKESAQILLPLRQELREHNQLTAIVSNTLSNIRKRGSKRALMSLSLPVWCREKKSRINCGGEVKRYMADAMGYKPNNTEFPEDEILPESESIVWIDEDVVKAKLKSSLPVINLMEWLKNNIPEIPDDVLLRLYHEMVSSDEWTSVLAETSQTTKLNHIKVEYHPHELQNAED